MVIGVASQSFRPGRRTNRVIATRAGDLLEDRIVTSTGSYDSLATMTASANCIMSFLAIKEATNQAPVVDAGPNQTITLPTNSVTLGGVVTDDGLPNNTLTISWTKVSGPGTLMFGNSSAALTQATFSTAGTYVLQLSANDSQLSANATTTVTVVSGVSTQVVLTPTAAQTVTVSSTSGPWILSGTLNAADSYGNRDASAPTVVPVNPGQQITVQYQSGLVSVGGGQSSYDGIGIPGVNGKASPYPGQYTAGTPNAGSLIGAWADGTGQLVASTFLVNDGVSLSAPAGAAQLQLGGERYQFC